MTYEALALSLSAWPSLPTMRSLNELRTERYSPLSRLSSMFLCCSAVSNGVPCSAVGLGRVDGPAESVMACEDNFRDRVESQHHVHQKVQLLVHHVFALSEGLFNVSTLSTAISSELVSCLSRFDAGVLSEGVGSRSMLTAGGDFAILAVVVCPLGPAP